MKIDTSLEQLPPHLRPGSAQEQEARRNAWLREMDAAWFEQLARSGQGRQGTGGADQGGGGGYVRSGFSADDGPAQGPLTTLRQPEVKVAAGSSPDGRQAPGPTSTGGTDANPASGAGTLQALPEAAAPAGAAGAPGPADGEGARFTAQETPPTQLTVDAVERAAGGMAVDNPSTALPQDPGRINPPSGAVTPAPGLATPAESSWQPRAQPTVFPGKAAAAPMAAVPMAIAANLAHAAAVAPEAPAAAASLPAGSRSQAPVPMSTAGANAAPAAEEGEAQEAAAAGEPPALPEESEAPAAQSVRITEDGDVVDLWVRDARLQDIQRAVLISTLVSELRSSGVRVRGASLNGTTVYWNEDLARKAPVDQFSLEPRSTSEDFPFEQVENQEE